MTPEEDRDLLRRVSSLEFLANNDLVINVGPILNDWDVRNAYGRLQHARRASMELSRETGNPSLEEAEAKIAEVIPRLEKELHDALWQAFHVRVISQLLTEAANQ